MRIQKFNENSEFDLTPEMKDFTEWCLKTSIRNGRYFYNSGQSTWYDDMAFSKMTWEEIFEVYLSEKYNTKNYNL